MARTFQVQAVLLPQRVQARVSRLEWWARKVSQTLPILAIKLQEDRTATRINLFAALKGQDHLSALRLRETTLEPIRVFPGGSAVWVRPIGRGRELRAGTAEKEFAALNHAFTDGELIATDTAQVRLELDIAKLLAGLTCALRDEQQDDE